MNKKESSKVHVNYIKPRTKEWERSYKAISIQIKLSKLRIRHSRLTYGYLITKNTIRQCRKVSDNFDTV